MKRTDKLFTKDIASLMGVTPKTVRTWNLYGQWQGPEGIPRPRRDGLRKLVWYVDDLLGEGFSKVVLSEYLGTRDKGEHV